MNGSDSLLLQLTWVLLTAGVVQVTYQCSTFPVALQHTWYRGSDGQTITITSTHLSGHELTAGSSSVSHFVLHDCDGSSYVFKTPNLVDSTTGRADGYICWAMTRITDSTYRLYQLTGIAHSGGFISQSVHEVLENSAPPSISDVCSLNRDTTPPTILYKLSGSATDVSVPPSSDVVQQCPPEVFATYTYVKDGAGCSGSSSSLDFCVDRETAHVDYSACSSPHILYSQGGVLSCLDSVSIGSDLYVLLVNHDSSVDNSNTYRVACMKVTGSGAAQQATVYPGGCASTTVSHQLELTRTYSCPITTTSSTITTTPTTNSGGGQTSGGGGAGESGGGGDGDGGPDIGLIVGVVVGVVVAALLVALLVYKFVCRKKEKRGVTPTTYTREASQIPGKEDNKGGNPPPPEISPRPMGRLPPLTTSKDGNTACPGL